MCRINMNRRNFVYPTSYRLRKAEPKITHEREKILGAWERSLHASRLGTDFHRRKSLHFMLNGQQVNNLNLPYTYMYMYVVFVPAYVQFFLWRIPHSVLHDEMPYRALRDRNQPEKDERVRKKLLYASLSTSYYQ
ncbi:hypothetical protein KQX54_019554 [Cotesia glomerata]|uniref:Uncharacterized protein n=1 Tax=Cotesia glomerata TaxID=32391 RepID=A0AAV7J600_COTGL|nr:hypothetical protein KQX54_019554 [Cotesia glomerata]